MNILHRYRHLLKEDGIPTHSQTTMATFTTVYRRVLELQTGQTFLDIGCSFGFLSLLVAEHRPSLKKVLGVDIRADPFSTTRLLAERSHLNNVQFLQADVLADDLSLRSTSVRVTGSV